MKRTLIALAVVGLAGMNPGCNCQHDGVGGVQDLGAVVGGDLSNVSSTDMMSVNQRDANACGDNDPTCTVGGPTSPPPMQFPLPSDNPPPNNVTADGVGRDPNGDLILSSTNSVFDFLWIADDTAYSVGLVSKVRTKPFATAPFYREVARYVSVTCQSDSVNGGKEGIVLGKPAPAPLCTDGVHGCCSRAESVPGPNGKHQPIRVLLNRPSRTAVDFNGDVWVANRAVDLNLQTPGQASVSKIANDPKDCIDRNHNGKIDTSSDINNDGIITTDCNQDGLPDDASTICSPGQSHEFYGLDDECILFTTDVGGPTTGYGRPLALGPGTGNTGASDAWAGTWMDGTFYRVDGTTGLIKATVKINPQPDGGTMVNSQPYGAAIDSFGILWAPNEGSPYLFYFDTNTPTNQGMVKENLGGGGFYGIAVDGFALQTSSGSPPQLVQQVWLGEVGANNAGAYRYRPVRGAGFPGLATGTWALANLSGGPAQGRGIGVDNRTPTSFAWVALDGLSPAVPSGALGRIPIDIPDGMNSLAASNWFSTTQNGTLGAGVAADLDLWGINQGSSSATHFKVDPAGNVLNAAGPDIVPLDDKPSASEDFCAPNSGLGTCKPHPYTYSDFTGFGLRNFTNPHGSYTWIQTGCAPMKTKWLKVVWDAMTPTGTTVTMKVRSADDATTLLSAPWTGGYTSSPADLSTAPGPVMPNPSGFLQVEFDLTTTDKSATPVLQDFHILYECLNQVG
jgi:hypothetical protein